MTGRRSGAEAAGEAYRAATDPDRQFRFSLDRAVDEVLAHLARSRT